MITRGQVAAKVAAHKERHPELYCPHDRCLWRTGGGACPLHKAAELRAINDELNALPWKPPLK